MKSTEISKAVSKKGKDGPSETTKSAPTFSSQELDQLAREAKKFGSISLDGLVRIMTQEEDYSEEVYAEAIPKLWEHYRLNRKGAHLPAVNTTGDRYLLWLDLLYRLCGFPIRGIPVGPKDEAKIYLNFYNYQQGGGFKKASYPPVEVGMEYIKLDEFKGCLKDLSDILNIRLPLPKRLFGEEEREDRTASGDKQVSKKFSHSPDYRTVNLAGKPFTLTSKQAQVIQMLWEAREAETPDLGQDYIIESVSGETATRRIKDFFRKTRLGREAWDQLIEPGKSKGTFRLKT